MSDSCELFVIGSPDPKGSGELLLPLVVRLVSFLHFNQLF